MHGTTCINALAGVWGEEKAEVNFQAYKMDFCSSDPEVQYSKYVLLLEQKLDDDVGNIEVELFLLKRNVKASVSSLGELCLDSDQVHTFSFLCPIVDLSCVVNSKNMVFHIIISS